MSQNHMGQMQISRALALAAWANPASCCLDRPWQKGPAPSRAPHAGRAVAGRHPTPQGAEGDVTDTVTVR